MIRTFPRAFAALIVTLIAMALAPAAVFAGDPVVKIGDLEISHAFTRAMAPNAPSGGGWVTITNHGSQADRLVSASSPRAKQVQLHSMTMNADQVMVMREMPDGVEIPAGATVELKPGGMHLMFMGVGARFKQGETVPVTLRFEKAGEVTIDLPVAALGATEMPMSGAMKMDMPATSN
jgi:hypothetical protein